MVYTKISQRCKGHHLFTHSLFHSAGSLGALGSYISVISIIYYDV